jgi:hypothetical protein
MTRHGWLILYHGVCEVADPSKDGLQLCYSAGVMVLSEEHPRIIRYRSVEPVLTPELLQERDGTVANVVFPTGIDRRDDLGLPDRFDVYYGMADNRIGVARLDIPAQLPQSAPADAYDPRADFSPTVNLKEPWKQATGGADPREQHSCGTENGAGLQRADRETGAQA